MNTVLSLLNKTIACTSLMEPTFECKYTLFSCASWLHSDIPDTLSLLTQCQPDLTQLADTAAHPPTRSKATKVPHMQCIEAGNLRRNIVSKYCDNWKVP